MNIAVSRPTHFVKTFTIGLAVSLALFLAAGVGSVYAANVSFTSTRNCGVNSIIHCGAMSISELQTRYKADTKAQTVYATYGITATEIDNLRNTAVAGAAHKDGTVTVNGKVVARNAVSAGYNSGTGRTKVTSNGVTFYNSPSSVVFVGNSIDAFVVLNEQGQFRYAILASCGNPMKATNVVPKPEKPQQPEKPVVVEKPVIVEREKVVEKPVVVEKVVEKPVTLPDTGPASVAGIFAGSSALAAVGHAFYTRRKRS